MIRHISSLAALAFALLIPTAAHGQPSCAHCGAWGVVELYSNADGSVQFLMLQSQGYSDGRPLAGQTLVASDAMTEHVFAFPEQVPEATVRPLLLATEGFAQLNLVKPDFIISAGFLPVRNGSVRLRDSSWWDRDVLYYHALPTDGSIALYMDIDGDFTDTASATNNVGQSYRFTPNAPNSFRMTAIFTDQAGLYQYIQLEEKSGLDNQHHFIGLTLEVTSRRGVFKSITFQDDLPTSATAGRSVLLGTSHVGPPQVDFMLPPGFLPTDGGTLVFAGVDVWDYAYLPTNGYTDVLRDGTFTSNPSWFRGLVFQPFTGFPTGLNVNIDPVIEYYSQRLDHYFISSSQPDLDLLDRTFDWRRTGESFPAWIAPNDAPIGTASPPNMGPVCRLYLPQGDRSSHFFSASAVECTDAQSQNPNAILETPAAFYASLPDPQTGQCLYDQIPLYRLWNARADTNHRFTTSSAIRDLMQSRGYVAEGYGPERVAMCVGGGIPSE